VFLYPNPVADRLNYFVGDENSQYSVSISDMTGKLCFSGNGFENEGSLDVSFLPAGYYSIRFVSGNSCQVMNFTIVR